MSQTFHYSGQMRFADNSQLWKQYLKKERDVTKSIQEYRDTKHFESMHGQRYGEGKLQRASRNESNIKDTLADNLKSMQEKGFHRTDYIKDQIDHFSDPSYAIIKPGFRPSMPFPNHDQLEVKHMYSFNAFGEPKHPRAGKDIFRTTMRQTLQDDGPYYKHERSQEPFNVKHGMIDPSHTYTHPFFHKSKRTKDLMAYDFKGEKQKDTRQL